MINDAGSFWLNISRLADSLDDCGKSAGERATTAILLFEQMPPVAKQEVLEALRRLAYELPDIYTIARGKPLERPSDADSEGPTSRPRMR